MLNTGACGGYSTELMARAVAPDGIVYGQNPPDLGEQAKAAFEARLKSPAMKDVVADIRPFDDPIPPGVHDLDFITFLFYYHDTLTWRSTVPSWTAKCSPPSSPADFWSSPIIQRCPAKASPSARHCIVSRKPTLRQEVEAAGFKLDRHRRFSGAMPPKTSHDFPSFKPDMPVDNFVLSSRNREPN